MKVSQILKTRSGPAVFAGLALSLTLADAQFVAYHDFGAITGEESTGNITTHQVNGADNSNPLDTSTKDLIDYATGSTTGVSLSVDQANGVDTRNGGQTLPPAGGTPADPLFNVTGLNLDNGMIVFGSRHRGGGRVDESTITLTGMNPGLVYDLALYGDRQFSSDGDERFTLGGADAATNSSSTGIIDTFTTDMETRPNATAGNVVRWTGINPGADGTITVLMDTDPGDVDVTNLGYISALRLEVVGATEALVLKIFQSGGNLDFEWNSLPGMQYDLLSDTDLDSDPDTWLPYFDGVTTYEDIPATGESTTLNGVAKVGGRRFFVLREEEVPPLLEEGFETDDGGFTVVDHSGGTGTLWERGDPDSTGLGGTVSEGNGPSTNCWGTDIGNPGFYETGTDCSLVSAVIDLTAVPDAVLSFAEAIDILGGDTFVVNVIDDDISGGISVLEAAVHTSSPDPAPSAAEWATVSDVPITGGQPVRIEWRFTGDNDGTYMGAYVDDVTVIAAP